MAYLKILPGVLVGLAALSAGVLGETSGSTNVVFGKLQDVEIELVNVPDSVGTGGKPVPSGADPRTSQDGRWLRIDVPFSTRKKFTPEIKFKFYLEGYEAVEAMGGQKAGEKFVVLTGEISYRDIPQGEKHYAGMFLSPAACLRYAGTKANGEADWTAKKMNLRVEANEQGSPVDGALDLQADKERGLSGRGGMKNPDWFAGTPPPGSQEEGGQVLEGVLLPIPETPFWPKDFKRYPQLKRP